MDFEGQNVEACQAGPDAILGLTSAKKSAELISIEDGKSEMAVSRNECPSSSKYDVKNEFLPEFVQPSGS